METVPGCHFSPIRLSPPNQKKKKSKNLLLSYFVGKPRKKEALPYFIGAKPYKPLRKGIWQYSPKSETYFPFDTVVTLLGTDPKQLSM